MRPLNTQKQTTQNTTLTTNKNNRNKTTFEDIINTNTQNSVTDILKNSNKPLIFKQNPKDPFNFNTHITTTKPFDFLKNYIPKTQCTSIYFGVEPILQECFTCSICDSTCMHKICSFCYKTCHEACRVEMMIKHPEIMEKEKNRPREFACYCGIRQKHIPEVITEKEIVSCNMIQLDIILQIPHYFCVTHNILICGICSVCCHKNCNVIVKDTFAKGERITCGCYSDYHTKYNELALNFPLEDYKKISGAKIWPIQILNILFQTKNTFTKMSSLFIEKLKPFSDKAIFEREQREKLEMKMKQKGKKVDNTQVEVKEGGINNNNSNNDKNKRVLIKSNSNSKIKDKCDKNDKTDEKWITVKGKQETGLINEIKDNDKASSVINKIRQDKQIEYKNNNGSKKPSITEQEFILNTIENNKNQNPNINVIATDENEDPDSSQNLNMNINNNGNGLGNNLNIDASVQNNQKTLDEELSNDFFSLLELFSNTFNRKFKTFYYNESLWEMFPFQNIFNFVKTITLTSTQTALTKFRLLFIILFIHLRKDYQLFKAWTSNDFLSTSILERLKLKKIINTKGVFSDIIYKKYKIEENFPLKHFALSEICEWMTKGMDYISMEENQDEFEIGLKFLCFMMKRLLFTKEDLIWLINSLDVFHSKFFDYWISEKDNIYSLWDIFKGIIEWCYMITINYNDWIVEKYIDNSGIGQFSKDNVSDFIHKKSEHGSKWLRIIIKNSKIITQHYTWLQKDDNAQEWKQQKEKLIQHHKIEIQSRILNSTTGVKVKIPENGGLFDEKILTWFHESLEMFCLADNVYNQQLKLVTKESLEDYYAFLGDISKEGFYSLVLMTPKKEDSNIIYHLKISLEALFQELFNSTYEDQDKFTLKFVTRMLNAVDLINTNCEVLENQYLAKVKKKDKEDENKNKDNRNKVEDPSINPLNKTLFKTWTNQIQFFKHKFLQNNDNNCIDNWVHIWICSNIDETFLKFADFLSNRLYPNYLTFEWIKFIFGFLTIFLLNKNGTNYFIIGKTISRLHRLINRFRFSKDHKNVNDSMGRSKEYNMQCTKLLLNFTTDLISCAKFYKISIAKHKVLNKFKNTLIKHLNFFSSYFDSEDSISQFKIELGYVWQLFRLLHEDFDWFTMENIKEQMFEIFVSSPCNFMYTENFTKWFKDEENKEVSFTSNRKIAFSYYFPFFELLCTNTYYLYSNDKYTKNLFRSIYKFIDLGGFLNIFNTSTMINVNQKRIWLKLIRTFYLIDMIEPINYLNRKHNLTTKEYKEMIFAGLIKNTELTNSIAIKSHFKNIETIKSKDWISKFDKLNELCDIFNLYINEFVLLPRSWEGEDLIHVHDYLKEIIFGIKHIGDYIYQERNISNKIWVYFYRVVKEFLEKKKILIHILNDWNNNWGLDMERYDDYNQDENFWFFKTVGINLYDKLLVYKYLCEGVTDIFTETKIDADLCLSSYLNIYDNINEANFTPFSLLEEKDYEYFYEDNNENDNNNNNSSDQNTPNDTNNPSWNKIFQIQTAFTKEFISITQTNFTNVFTSITNESVVFNYSLLMIHYFCTFLNSTDSDNLIKFRCLLCIINKIGFYNTELMQKEFHKLLHNKNFFTNFNRELTYKIVLCLSSSKNSTLINTSSTLIDISKLILQFLQLLGEGFHTPFHPAIFFTNDMNNKHGKIILDDDYQKNNDDEIISEEIIRAAEMESLKKLNAKSTNHKPPWMNPKTSIYQTVIINLQRIYNLMDLGIHIHSELPFDKMCILTVNLIDFIIEYIKSNNDKINALIDKSISKLVFGAKTKYSKKNDPDKYEYEIIEKCGIGDVFKIRIEEEGIRHTMICFMKIKYAQLIISYLQNGYQEKFVNSMLENDYGPMNWYEEIVEEMKKWMVKFESKEIRNSQRYIKQMVNWYIENEEFRETIEWNVVFKLYTIIKILGEIYGIDMLKVHFEKMENEVNQNDQKYEESKKQKAKKKGKEEENKLLPKGKLGHSQDPNDNHINDDEEDKNSPYMRIQETYNNWITNEEKNKRIKNVYSSDQGFSNIGSTQRGEDDNDDSKTNGANHQRLNPTSTEGINSIFSYCVFKFLEELILKVQIRIIEDENESKFGKFTSSLSYKISTGIEEQELQKTHKTRNPEDEELGSLTCTFFVRPYLTYHLSSHSKNRFYDSVNRSTTTTKFMDLMLYTDYFIFEMIANYYSIGSNSLRYFLANISFYYLEIFNYLFIIIQNCLIVAHYYRSPDLPLSEYDIESESAYNRYSDNYYISLVQLAYLVLCLINWWGYKFFLSWQRNLMLSHNKNFVFRKENVNEQNITNPVIIGLFKKEVSVFSALKFINRDIGFFQFIYSWFIDTLFFNREIFSFIFNIIFNVLFVVTSSSMFLVIPVIFITNISQTLFDIFNSVKLKIGSITIVYIFTYIWVYWYGWFTFFYLREFFYDDEIKEVISGETITESFCSSSVQCFWYVFSIGLRAGGGIGEEINQVSFQTDPSFFMLRFFYDIIFHIFIIMVWGNVSLGIIVDAFAELRDWNYERENDMKNKCFICQISRDDCLIKNIDYNTHVKQEHFLWNYVYFLTHLHLSNSNNFNCVEKIVWEKLKEQDYGWIPLSDEVD